MVAPFTVINRNFSSGSEILKNESLEIFGAADNLALSSTIPMVLMHEGPLQETENS